MKREKEKNLLQEQEEKKELPVIIPMLSGAITLICLTISLVVAFPALTRSGDLTYDTQESDFSVDVQDPSSSDHESDDGQNGNNFMDDFNEPTNDFGKDNIGYDIFVD